MIFTYTREQAALRAGRAITDDEAERIARALEHSTIWEAIDGAIEQVCVLADEDEDERPTCPDCGPGETLEGQYLVDASEARGEYDGWLCSRCRGFWTVAELDATSAYRQAYIDGDAVAERIRARAEGGDQ